MHMYYVCRNTGAYDGYFTPVESTCIFESTNQSILQYSYTYITYYMYYIYVCPFYY